MDEHGKSDGSDCVICFCEIDDETYCEYKVHAIEEQWTPSPICTDCIELLRTTQWKTFQDQVAKVDCRRAALNLCRSVPLYVHDHATFKCTIHTKEDDPCPNHGQVEQLWIANTNEVIIPILEGAKTGEERDAYIAHLLQFAMLFEEERDEDIANMTAKNDS